MLDFHKIEEDTLAFWKKHKTYAKVKEKNKKGTPFYFLQGPPYTSGKLHIAHAWNNTLKDMILRYKRMNGFDVFDRGGYDMHGLPTENAVQKKLKLKTKEEIEEYGVEKFIKECMNFSVEHAGYMNEDLWRLGVWMDHEGAYKPIEKEFVGGEWAFFKKAWEQGRLYKGLKTMHWDAETETSLAKHELEYKTVVDKSVFLKFKKKGTDNEYFVIWTTTPWTIPLNLAIMAGPEIEYVKIKVDNEYWILAKALVGIFMNSVVGKKFEIVEEFLGKELEGQEYEHFFAGDMPGIFEELKKESPKIHTIILSEEYVDTTSGSGLVHCAPGCGPEDFEVGKANGIEPFNTLNERGEFENSGKFTGWVAKVEDKKFIKAFEEKDVLLATTDIEHEYPHSWRSHKPVVFRTTEQWFLKTEDLSKELLKNNKKVHWVPKKSGESYERWAENLRDNGVTRQRYWGCPVPVWVNEEDPEDYFVVGSLDEFERLTGKKVKDDLEVHRPWIDNAPITKDGKTYKRILDVADVWIDSGTASWNALHNDPALIKKYFPADLVLEATEQTRLWFSLLQICSAVMFDDTSYKNVFVHGMIFDYQGMKMSKSLGNIISPYEVVDKYSADTLRYYMCENTAGENINFSWDDIKVKQRNMIILGNIANFLKDLAQQKPKAGKPSLEEKWILSRYHSTLKKVTELFEGYRLNETITEIEKLFMSLSRDYIRYVRDKAGTNAVVLDTIKEIYLGILKMFATIAPFYTEYLWQLLRENKFVEEESVHLTEWPKYDAKQIDEKLEADFVLAMEIIEKGLSQRDKAQIGLRWPLANAEVTLDKKAMSNASLPKDLESIILSQLNVKKLTLNKKDGVATEVTLDTTQTDELLGEGFAREIARKIQAERKNAGLQKGDVIKLSIVLPDEIADVVTPHLDFLKERTNTKELILDDKNAEKSFSVRDKKIKFAFSIL